MTTSLRILKTGVIIGALALLGVTEAVLANPETPKNPSPTAGGALSVRSDVQEANSETGVITARGNVQINYPAQQMQATAAQAQYFSRERRLVLSGNVYVLQKGNSMRAETMTYSIDEGRFIAMPSAGQQVEALYIVPEETNPQGAPKKETLPKSP